MQMEMIKFCNVCHAIKCARVLKDHEYWTWTVNPVHKQWCTSPMWLGYFSWAKKDFLRVHIPTIYYMQNKKGKKNLLCKFTWAFPYHFVKQIGTSIKNVSLRNISHLYLCDGTCYWMYYSWSIWRHWHFFFRFKFEEYIPLVMIFDKNIKETFSTT